MSWIVTMFGWFSDEADRASCSNRLRRSGVGGELGREDLDRDLAAQALVARAVDLAHASGPERREDLVRAKT